jgi:peptide/nickel transport system ATP-binding protein
MPSEILEICDLSVSFWIGMEDIRVVDNISFVLKKGCITGIVGESGSGKSVTALSLLRLLPSPPAIITAEKMLLYGPGETSADLLLLSSSQMQQIRGNRISMIFQEPMTSLNPVTRCGNQVVESIRAHQDISKKEAKQKTLDLFREVMLPSPEAIFRAYPHEISGGQKQRVMIAMAVASHPDILIADEPTTALDVTVQQSIIKLLKDLREKYGMAVLFITHDLNLVRIIADELLVMKNGRIVEAGPVEKVFSNPQHPYTKSLLESRLQRDEDKFHDREQVIYSQKPLLEAENVKTYFPSKIRESGKKTEIKAVDDVSLSVYPGEILGLVGESGCGKTTLGRSILRLIEPVSGKIIFKGMELTGMKPGEMKKMRKNMQIIFQDPYSSLNPKMTVGEAILEPMTVHRIGKNREERRKLVIDLLQKTGLAEVHFHRYPHELSGGQRQRVCIARALAVRPEFIVCDESVSALDVTIQAQVLKLLQDLQEEFKFTYIFISHDLSVVNFLSDRVAVMKDGKIIETGKPGKIFHSPESEYTKKLIEAIP